MDYRAGIGGIVMSVVMSTSALAQSTLGELLDAGGKRMAAADVASALSGASVDGPTKPGGMLRADFKADGSFSGTVQGPSGGKPTGIVGTWAVDANGKLCTEFTLTATATGMRKDSSCGYYFKNGDQYYVTESGTDRSALLLKRTIKK